MERRDSNACNIGLVDRCLQSQQRDGLSAVIDILVTYRPTRYAWIVSYHRANETAPDFYTVLLLIVICC